MVQQSQMFVIALLKRDLNRACLCKLYTSYRASKKVYRYSVVTRYIKTISFQEKVFHEPKKNHWNLGACLSLFGVFISFKKFGKSILAWDSMNLWDTLSTHFPHKVRQVMTKYFWHFFQELYCTHCLVPDPIFNKMWPTRNELFGRPLM